MAAVWQSSVVREQIEKKAKTTAGIHKINQADIRSLVFPLPPLVEQERIFAALDNALSKHDSFKRTVTANLRRIDRVRQSILKWAFEGKLVDQDPNDEPASVLLDRIRQERSVATTEAKRPPRVPIRKTA